MLFDTKSVNVLDTIMNSKIVVDENGGEHQLEANISENEIKFIESIINKNEIKKSLEIGCAMGISSLAICSNLVKKGKNFHHTIIDPNQSGEYKNIGINNLRKAGILNFKLFEKGSELALPELLNAGEKYDLIFIDGLHTMDQTLLDLYYANRLLNVGGLVLIDDVVMKPVNKAVRYFINYPNFRLVAANPNSELSIKRKIYYLFAEVFSFCSNIVPFRRHLFNMELINTDRKLGIGTSMVAFRKTDEDNRSWNWYKSF